MAAGGSLLAPTKLDDREINMSKIAKESILLMSLFLIAATVQFFAQSLPMALCFYFLPTLYSAYHFGRRHATLTAFACVFLVVLLDFLNNMMPGHRVLSLPGERLFNFAIWAGVLAVTGYVMGTLYERKQAMTTDIRESFSGLLLVLQHFMANEKLGVGENQRVVEASTRMAEAMGLGDVKFSVFMGLVLGLRPTLTAVFLGVILAGVAALGLVLLRRRTMRDSIAYGPFLAAGALAALFELGAS